MLKFIIPVKALLNTAMKKSASLKLPKVQIDNY